MTSRSEEKADVFDRFVRNRGHGNVDQSAAGSKYEDTFWILNLTRGPKDVSRQRHEFWYVFQSSLEVPSSYVHPSACADTCRKCHYLTSRMPM